MRLDTIYNILEYWQPPERLTNDEKDECVGYIRDAASSVESILYITEEKHPHENGVSE